MAALTLLLEDSDEDVARAAAAAIGRVGTPTAAKTLTEALLTTDGRLRSAMAAACLPCAEKLLADGEQSLAVQTYEAVRRAAKIPQHVEMAALRGLLLARGPQGLPLLVETLNGKSETAFNVALIAARELPGTEVTKSLVAQLAGLSLPRQAKLIGVLGERGDRLALPAVLAAVRGGIDPVRTAALGTLTSLGDASVVPFLIEVAARSDGQAAELARTTLASLPGKDVDDALLVRLAHGDDATLRPAVLEAVGQRRIRSAVPTLRKAAAEPDARVRLAAIGALGQTVTLEELPILVTALKQAESRDEQAAVLNALKSAAGRMPDRDACTAKLLQAMAVATVVERCLLLEVFIPIGDASALVAVSSSAKDENEQIRAAATQVLGNWESEKAAYALLDHLKSSRDSNDRLRVLRAFSGLVRRLGFPKEERIGVCRQAMELSRDDEERKIVLHTLAGIPAPETLTLLASYLTQPGLTEDVSQAAITICKRIVRSRRTAVASSMAQVLEATKNADTAKQAKNLLEQAEAKP